MTSLEQTLATLLHAIEQAREVGNSRMLQLLLDRKNAICRALAAPEHNLFEPQPAEDAWQLVPALVA